MHAATFTAASQRFQPPTVRRDGQGVAGGRGPGRGPARRRRDRQHRQRLPAGLGKEQVDTSAAQLRASAVLLSTGLSHFFAKLDISSRGQLDQALASDPATKSE
jgi:hypothetical protein